MKVTTGEVLVEFSFVINVVWDKEINNDIGPDMDKAVGRQLLVVEAAVQSQASSCEICGGQNGIGFPSEYFNFPLPVLFHRNSMLIYLSIHSSITDSVLS